MAGGTTFKISKFFGEAPKLAPEALPDTVAQFAFNSKLYSGDLIPYRKSSLVQALSKTGTIKTIFPMDDGAGGYKWLHWTEDVDLAVGQIENDTTQRTYYSGQGEPRVTNYALATTGAGTDYPIGYYTLGLPAPVTAPSATAVGFAQLTSVSRARDSANIATIVTSTPHGFYTGAYITLSGFSGTGYNITNVAVTVVNSTTFSFFCYGTAEGTTADTGGKIDLAGTTTPRTYVYTWYTAWGEESSPSAPSAAVFVKEGQTVNLSGLPSAFPTTGTGYAGGTYQTTNMKMRVYRSVASASGTNYYYLGSVVLGPQSGTYSRSGTAVTVTATGHGLKVGQSVSLTFTTGGGTSGTYTVTASTANTFNITDSVSGTTSGNVTINAVTTFVDNYDLFTLSTALTSQDYDPPPSILNGAAGDMQGMLAIHNGMMVGFFGNTVCFCEPGKPHAWPIKYRKQVDSKIVAIGNVGTTVVVATDGRPWLMNGNAPFAMTATKTDFVLPCLSKRSLVNMGYGVAYASPGGLALYSTASGGNRVTEHVHSWDTWQDFVPPASVIGCFYQDKYFGTSGTKSFIFERNQQVGGYLIQSDTTFTAGRYLAGKDLFFYVKDGSVYKWDDPTQPFGALDWKSKVFVMKDYCNLGAARIVADYDAGGGSDAIVAYNNAVTASNNALIAAGNNMGALGTAGFGEVQTVEPLGTFLSVSAKVTFQLYANKKLVFTRDVINSEPFRLPATYRTDTFEVRVSTDLRVRAIHVAETLAGLKFS